MPDQNDLHSKPSANPYASLSTFIDDKPLDGRWVSEILTSYLPKSPRGRDRKAIDEMLSDFVKRADALSPEQREFLKRRLLEMAPEGKTLLEAAHTTTDSTKAALAKLLDEAGKQ